ncbi:ribonuclease BN [Streptomyces sp. NPDC093221]|uniref:ribonuclease BN n=1 Tax=unclassified Streptomyces TaxID=2593676 RepID=UPI0036DFACAF
MVDLRRVWEGSAAGRVWRKGAELELLQRSMGFAALGLVTLMPLLIVVAAAAPFQRTGFAQWVVDGMGLSPHPAESVQRLFATPRRVLSTTSALSLASLAIFGLSFAASVETGYRKVWELPASPWHSVWRRAVWLAGLTAYLFAEAQSGAFLSHGWRQAVVRITLTLVFGVLFFWWGQRFLLGGLITWRAALPGAVLTMAGLVGLRGFSWLVFSPLIVTNAVTYGSVGTVLMVQCWLIGVGFVFFGGPLIGCEIQQTRARRAAGPQQTGTEAETATEAETETEGEAVADGEGRVAGWRRGP